jgi:glycine oxidase
MSAPRVTIVGAGAIGAACARELADAGAEVRVLDAGVGRAAGYWAAAGILSPSHPDRQPEAVHVLAARSLALWEELARRHPELELRRPGVTLLDDDPGWLAWRRGRGLPVEPAEWTRPDGARVPAVRLPEVAVARAPRLAPALLAGIPVERSEVGSLAALRGEADLVVIAAGAWSAPLLAEAGLDLKVAPRRGQMLLFDRGDLDTILMRAGGEGLAVPRADGPVVVGTTLEDAGFDASTRPADLDRLEGWAREWVPGLGARVDSWAGMRPWSLRATPVIGRLAPDVIAAVGHFRNGVLLAPGTGELVADLALGRAPRVPPAPYAP